LFEHAYEDVLAGDERWRALSTPAGATFTWDPGSTYIRRAPYFDGMGPLPERVADIHGARVLALLGDSVTTDHISPAGAIPSGSPAAAYLETQGVAPRDFNSYGSRRGNHEVMVRGTFANIRLRNRLVDVPGGLTRNFLTGQTVDIFGASVSYRQAGIPLVVIAGREYGSGSSRDWAAKGTALLGVRAVIVESYERIHRSNLIGMGVAPLQFEPGAGARELGLDGTEVYNVLGLADIGDQPPPRTVTVEARRTDGTVTAFTARLRIDTPAEAAYFRHGGILPYVLRKLAGLVP
jgi:aconitate hydratase